jgi:hypothetical protein
MCLHLRIGILLAGAAFALQGPARAEDDPFSAANAVAPAILDDLRGGFTTAGGLTVTLGLERIITINGNVAEHSQLDFGDLGRLTSGQAQLSADSMGQLRLIQNGAAGDVAVQLGANTLGGTVIQNSLNDQVIRNQTIINASVDARGLLQALNFQSTLANALNNAATGR